jgi:hypothetical protein
MKCDVMKSQRPDLLLDDAFAASDASAHARQHLAGCAACREEFEGLRATMQLMDMWQAPEPSAYFDTRMQSRLREVIGGATYAGITFMEQPQPPAQESAALRDLQSLDRNAQTLDDLDSLDQQLNDSGSDNSSQ